MMKIGLETRQKHPNVGKISTCRGCGAPILWLISPKDKLTPIDPAPTARGNLRIDLDYGVWLMILNFGEVPPEERYISHFATCPNAKEFRRG